MALSGDAPLQLESRAIAELPAPPLPLLPPPLRMPTTMPVRPIVTTGGSGGGAEGGGKGGVTLDVVLEESGCDDDIRGASPLVWRVAVQRPAPAAADTPTAAIPSWDMTRSARGGGRASASPAERLTLPGEAATEPDAARSGGESGRGGGAKSGVAAGRTEGDAGMPLPPPAMFARACLRHCSDRGESGAVTSDGWVASTAA